MKFFQLIKRNTFLFYLYFVLFVAFFSSLSADDNQIPKDLQDAKYVTVIEKNDGFGSQLLRRMSAIAFANFHDKIYVHLPFTELQHNYGSDKNFANKMEAFANIGMGSLLKENINKDLFYLGGEYWGFYISLSTNIGRKLKEKQDQENNSQKENFYHYYHYRDKYYSFNGLEKEDLAQLLNENLEHPYIYAREDYLYYINKNVDAYFNKDVIELLRNSYYASEKKIIPYFNNNKLNVAIHIRRGDVSPQTNKDEYFLSIIEIIRKKHPTAIFHIFSEGNEDLFVKFRSKDIILHLNEDIRMTFHALVTADVLVTSKSAFSYAAAILSKGIIYCPKNYWNSSLKHWIEKE
jgi:hypothetical protein